MKQIRRHAAIYAFFRFILTPFIKIIYNFRMEPVDEEGAYIVLANHNLTLDPLLIGAAFKRQMYFVASEHVYRKGFLSSLLRFGFAPIARVKGSTDPSAAVSVIKTVRAGGRVCIFAEGNRSWNGRTGMIHPSTAKLVKTAGVSLITYRFKGGYFTEPRWGFTVRRGAVTGTVSNIYTAEQIKGMTVEELEARIREDLREDAYQTQEKAMVRFRGRRLAEGMELALFICPSCRRVGTLGSVGNEFFCSCGMHGAYDEYGYISGDGVSFSSITEWDDWQRSEAERIVSENGEVPFFSDLEITLYSVSPSDHTTRDIVSGTLSLDRCRLICGDAEFLIEEISDMSIHSRWMLVFTHKGVHYGVRPSGKNRFCALKYLVFYMQLKKGFGKGV